MLVPLECNSIQDPNFMASPWRCNFFGLAAFNCARHCWARKVQASRPLFPSLGRYWMYSFHKRLTIIYNYYSVLQYNQVNVVGIESSFWVVLYDCRHISDAIRCVFGILPHEKINNLCTSLHFLNLPRDMRSRFSGHRMAKISASGHLFLSETLDSNCHSAASGGTSCKPRGQL